MKNLAKKYQPQDFEPDIYEMWEQYKDFNPQGSAKPFVIVMPPPNVTGVLHLGHGLNAVLQDTLIRYHRMIGDRTLWIPGTDHAGIATQFVVEKAILARGLTLKELGREGFLEEAWNIKEKHYEIINRQLKKMGVSCAWSYQRFTMDAGMSKAVTEVFVRMYEDDDIYRGEYLVNWCPTCGTALADEEVEYQEESGKLYTLEYKLAGGAGAINVATTRPETLFGDVAVAVHPADERYQKLIGKKVKLPLSTRCISIIADEHCNPEFGSGAVKITPAHDHNDWQVAQRHDLAKINILNKDATLNDEVPAKYRQLSVKEARDLVLEDLSEEELLIAEEPHHNQVGKCYRCYSIIEPYMSTQWFVRMKDMAAEALVAQQNKDIEFYPGRWQNTYKHWLRNIRDWCISRQLWWGHRIPAWYCRSCKHITVSRVGVNNCEQCASADIYQDEDVLDTWFSSWLWPFSTLGWPAASKSYEDFYPTTTMLTGFDIIFFWVARMIMAGQRFTKQVPFKNIYLTPLVRDIQGRKMSKSLGNGIDPLDIVDEYSADALKFTLVYLANQGQDDLLLNKDSFQLGAKFCNKIWNAARFVLMHIENKQLEDPAALSFDDLDSWILGRLNACIAKLETAIKSYRFDDMGHAVYEYFWNDFCDWYLELKKAALYETRTDENIALPSVLCFVLEKTLRLLHPFISFLSEYIYQYIPTKYRKADRIIIASFPQLDPRYEDKELAENFSLLQNLISSIRTVRSEFRLAPNQQISLRFKCTDTRSEAFCLKHLDMIKAATGAQDSKLLQGEDTSNAIESIAQGFQVYLFIKDYIDLEHEQARMLKQQDKLLKQYNIAVKKLSNPQFLSRAPADIIDNEKLKLREFEETLKKLTKYLAQLKS